MHDGNSEEAVRALEETSKSVPPSNECSDNAEGTTGLDDGNVGGAVRVLLEMADSEKEEGDVEENEERAEGDSGLESAESEEEGEDEPTIEV